MKKALLIGASLVVSLGTAAQTLNVVVGEVTYKIPASQAGSMDYADGSRLTILGKTFQLKEVTRMYVDHSDVADNSVNVTYNGSAAAVTVAGNCMSHLDVTANGSAVSIVQDETVDTEISYSLSGASDNGSFYCFRHSYATLQLELGTDIYTIKSMLGHTNVKTTQIYSHIVDSAKEKAANTIHIDNLQSQQPII